MKQRYIPPQHLAIRVQTNKKGIEQDILVNKITGEDIEPIANAAHKDQLLRYGYGETIGNWERYATRRSNKMNTISNPGAAWHQAQKRRAIQDQNTSPGRYGLFHAGEASAHDASMKESEDLGIPNPGFFGICPNCQNKISLPKPYGNIICRTCGHNLIIGGSKKSRLMNPGYDWHYDNVSDLKHQKTRDKSQFLKGQLAEAQYALNWEIGKDDPFPYKLFAAKKVSNPQKTSKLEELKTALAKVNTHVATYSPGDGVTRYRFFDKPTSYFAGDGIYTALGWKEAVAFARGRGAII